MIFDPDATLQSQKRFPCAALGRLPSDRVILVGDLALERDWYAAGRLAAYLPADRYFGADA